VTEQQGIHLRSRKKADVQTLVERIRVLWGRTRRWYSPGEGHAGGNDCGPPKTLSLRLSPCSALPVAESSTQQHEAFQRDGAQAKTPLGASSRAGFRL